MDVVDEAEVVVGEEKGVGAECAGCRRGGTVARRPCRRGGEEAGDERAWCAVGGRELDDAVAGADAGMAGSVQRDEESVVERGIVVAEEGEAERRGVRGEGGVGRGNASAGGSGSGSLPRFALGSGLLVLPPPAARLVPCCGHAGLLAVDGVGVLGGRLWLVRRRPWGARIGLRSPGVGISGSGVLSRTGFPCAK